MGETKTKRCEDSAVAFSLGGAVVMVMNEDAARRVFWALNKTHPADDLWDGDDAPYMALRPVVLEWKDWGRPSRYVETRMR